MKVDTIIVNFRTPDLTVEAANSVLDDPLTNSVIVVENASGDDSLQRLQSELADERVQIVETSENKGFGAGNNLGLKHASAEFVFLLNSDATISPGGLRAMVDAFKLPGVGIAAPYVFEPGMKLQERNYGLFPTPKLLLTGHYGSWSPGTPAEWVSGVAMMLRRETMVDLGGFDEDIFMYMEDVDLCKRVVDAGLSIVRIPEAHVTHLGGASSSSSSIQKEQFRKSADYYLAKHGFSSISRSAVKMARSLRAKLKG